MQKHSEIGCRIAHTSPDLLPITNLILKHHEWWNGQGYPLGLSGVDIPVECRLLAIADSFDAMTTDRPYRQARTMEAALAELHCIRALAIEVCIRFPFAPTSPEYPLCFDFSAPYFFAQYKTRKRLVFTRSARENTGGNALPRPMDSAKIRAKGAAVFSHLPVEI